MARYYRNYRKRTPRPTSFTDGDGVVHDLVSPSIAKRIEKTLPYAKKDNNSWAVEFLTSIGEAFKKYERLSEGQYTWLQKIEKQYSSEARAAKKNWCDNFTDEMRKDMILAAKIQEQNNASHIHAKYWKDLVAQILANPEGFVPTEKQWTKFVQNNYVQKKINIFREKPKFEKGSAVSLRGGAGSNCSVKINRKNVPPWKVGIILEVNPEYPETHARGGKRYLVIPVGAVEPVVVEERQIKKYRG